MPGFRCAYGLVVILLAGMVAGCGQQTCTRAFVNEFNNVKRLAATAGFGSADRVRQAAKQFQTKHAGVKCRANTVTAKGLRETTVDADAEMNKILDDIKNLP